MLNLMQDANQNPRDGINNVMSVTVLYTKYDMLQVASIVGTKQASEMAQSSKSTHVFMTGEWFVRRLREAWAMMEGRDVAGQF